MTAAATINAYRPLARNGFASLWSVYWPGGCQFPTLASQLGRLVTAQRLTTSAGGLLAGSGATRLELLNLQSRRPSGRCPTHRRIRQRPGPDRRTASAGAARRRRWCRQNPRAAARCGSTAITHTMATSATANTAGPTTSISGASRSRSDGTPVLFPSGAWTTGRETNADRRIH